MSNEAVRDVFVTGLRNAHALENQALSIMNRQLERLENYPELAARLRTHVDETNQQIGRLDNIFQELGESHSSLKDTAASFMGSMASLGHAVADDEILKNSFANYAFENYEIAAYRSLITVAQAAGMNGAVSLLDASLKQEQDMAGWLEQNLPMITQRYLQLEASGMQANR